MRTAETLTGPLAAPTTTGLPKAVIFDFDGTLADVAPFYDRFPADLTNRDPEHWDDYHDATRHAAPIGWVLQLARMEARSGQAVLVVTARPERWRDPTSFWLDRNPIPHTELLMRAAGDHRPDAVMKGELLADLRTRYDVLMAVDDRPSVVDFWRGSGLPTVHVPGWPANWPTR